MRTYVEDLLELVSNVLLTTMVVVGTGFLMSFANPSGEPWWPGMIISAAAGAGFVICQIAEVQLFR